MFNKFNIEFDSFKPLTEDDLIKISSFLEDKGFDTFVNSINFKCVPLDQMHLSFGAKHQRHHTECIRIGDTLLINHEMKMLRIIQRENNSSMRL